MFDWNDEELSNIIWGEAGEGEDHIVPYPDANEEKSKGSYGGCIKKGQNQEALNIKPAEHKKTISLTDVHGVKRDCSPQYDKNEGFSATEFSLESWPDLSLPSAAKTDQESMGTETPDVTKISKHDTRSDGKTAILNITSEIFESRLEDDEQGDFVDYGWASVGSFEDLDRIFSNEDPIFGHGTLGNPDELWSTSKDVISSPERSIPPSGDSPSLALGTLSRMPELFEGQGEYLSDQNQPFTPGYEKLNLVTANIPQDVKSCIGNIKYPRNSSKLSIKEKTAFKIGGITPVYNLQLDTGNVAATNEYTDKANRQKKLVKGRKKSEEKSEVRHLQNLQAWTQTGDQFLHFDSPYVPHAGQPSSSLVFGQQGQLQQTESSEYKHFLSPLLTSFMHGSISKQYTATPVLSPFHSDEGSNQLALSSYEVPPGNVNPLTQSTKLSTKSMVMTPQEKIEKLRRRQQMRAMLAIQKQQQQLGNQVSSTEYSVMEGENSEAEENLSTLPSLDANSPVEQDDSNAICMARDDCSVQDSILYQLQDIVGKLDHRIRLCIRDSLFRLAQSATQRQYASDTSSSIKSSRDEAPSKEETNGQNRFSRTSEVEVETNPIDRTVAHLLFHRRMEFAGKVVETPDSPLSAKLLPFGRKASSSMSLLTQSLSQRSETNQIPSHEESELPCLCPKQDEFKSRIGLDASENASTIKAADNGKMKVEASQ